MGTSWLANLILLWRKWHKKYAVFLNDIIISYSLCSIQHPFKIHPTAEFRNPKGISIANNCIIKRGVILDGRSSSLESGPGIVFGPETYIKENCYIDSYGGFVHIDGHVAIGQFCMLAGQGGVKIGKYVMLGGHCYILTSNHITESFDVPYMLQGDRCEGVVIQDNVWIGGGSIILAGVKIGRNSVVGAGSIVTKDIPANSMYVDRNPNLLKEVMLKICR